MCKQTVLRKRFDDFMERCKDKGSLKEIQSINESEGKTEFADMAWDFFLAFAKYHPKSQQKLHLVVDAKVIPNKKYGGVNLVVYVIHSDGTEDDFSINKCITKMAGKPEKFELTENMRKATSRHGTLRSTCNNCSVEVQSHKQAIAEDKYSKAIGEVDHIRPFNELKDEFIQLSPPDNTDEWMDRWCEFHFKNATLQTLCLTCHREKTERERTKRQKKS